MSAWRARALELFPDMRATIQGADSAGMLWIELCFRFEDHYKNPDISQESPDLIHNLYLYAVWCTRSSSDEVSNAATIGFYEHVARFAFSCEASKYQLVIHDLVANIGLPEILRLPFAYPIERHQYETFLTNCVEVDRDLRQRRKKGRPRQKQS